ncbi:MAG TPA: hemolysin III family protein [Acidimicrobiales bacterium]|nr:hemolysin III family protein [Acidimicrobiales bacterium]
MSASPHTDHPLPPLLRGWVHLVFFFLSLPAAVAVVTSAGSPRARAGAVVYATGLCALFGVSATYHRLRWSPAARRRMRRMDHATIFVMIAGSYTPLCLLVLRGDTANVILTVAWMGAVVGVILASTGIAERSVFGLACYIALGWVMVGALPQLLHRLSAVQMLLIVVGGVLYTAGAIILGTRRPDPFPRVFGYHEVWHVMVAAAAVCHYVTIFSVVRTG